MLYFHFSAKLLSPQVTASEAMRILASHETASDTEILAVADTMLGLGDKIQAVTDTQVTPNITAQTHTPTFHYCQY